MLFRNNRIARCTGTEKSEGGGRTCEGDQVAAEPTAQTSDGQGYWPRGGFFGTIDPSYNPAVTTISGNVWDNNLEEAP